MDRWSYEATAEAWCDIVGQASAFEGELFKLNNPSSYIDRCVLRELRNEVACAREFVLAVLYLVSGWTADELDSENQRRLDSVIWN